jgi:hypothetical protein
MQQLIIMNYEEFLKAPSSRDNVDERERVIRLANPSLQIVSFWVSLNRDRLFKTFSNYFFSQAFYHVL